MSQNDYTPESGMECDIVIPVWNLMQTTKLCVESIIKHTVYPYRLIMVDNGSDEPTKNYLASLKDDARIPKALLIRNEKNLGAAPAFNQGMKAATAPYVLLLNNDTIVTHGWLTEMVRAVETNENIGIVNPDSNNLGTHIPKNMSLDEFEEKCVRKNRGKFIEISCAIGFCYLMTRRLLDTIGIWSEEYGSGNYEETEHCVLAREAGFKMLVAKGSFVYHEEHATFKTLTIDKAEFDKIFEYDKQKFEEKYGRTKRALFVITQEDQRRCAQLSDAFYNAAHSGIWVHAIMKKELRAYTFREHGWTKLFFYPSLCFQWLVLIKILTKKKKYDEIYIDDKKTLQFLQQFAAFHKAELIHMA